MKFNRLFAATAVATLLTSAASAATVTDNITFSATGFTSAYGGAQPVDPVQGAFKISFDPTQTYLNSTAGISLTSLNIALGSALSFDYSPTTDSLVVGGLFDGAGVIQISPSTDDFYVHINNFTTAPAFGQLGYTQVSSGPSNYFYTTTADGDSVSVTPVTGGVPEPATWAMMLVGLGGLGAAMRTRRRQAFTTA